MPSPRRTAGDPHRPPPPPRTRRPRRARRRVAHRRAGHLPRRGRPQRRRQVDAPADPGRPARARLAGDVRVDPPTATVGYLSQEHARARTARRCAPRCTGAPVSPRRGGAGRLRRPASAAGEAGARRPLRRQRSPATSRSSAGDFEARLVTTLEQVGLPPNVAGAVRLPRCRVARRRGWRWRPSFSPASTSPCSTSRPTTSTSTAWPGWRTWWPARRGGMVIVSHDRAFLDRTVTDVLELDEHSRSGRIYGGGWAGYQSRARGRPGPRRRGLRGVRGTSAPSCAGGPSASGSGPRRASPARRSTPATTTRRSGTSAINRTERLAVAGAADRARARGARRRSRSHGRAGTCASPSARRPGRAPSWSASRTRSIERGDFTLGPLTLDIAWADRIALVGPNGSGKTTLVEAMLGRLPLAPGRGAWARASWSASWPRTGASCGDAPSLVDAFMAATGLLRDRARSQLAKFGLGADAVLRPPSSLSPGERTRAELAAFAATGVNFLVLDEPTNHLDLPGHRAARVGPATATAARCCSSRTTAGCSRR